MASSSVLSMAAGMQASITQLRTEKDNLEAEAAALKAKTEYTQNESLSFIEKRDGVLAENEDLRKQLVRSHALSGGANKTQLCFLSGLDNDAKDHAPEVLSASLAVTVAADLFATLAVDAALQAFEERTTGRAAHLRSGLAAAAHQREVKHAADGDLAAAKNGQASSSRLAVEKADALVNAGLAAKTLEDKLRTAAASLDKLGGEATKLAEQRSRLEAAFVASRDAKSAELVAAATSGAAAERDWDASQGATRQLVLDTDAFKARGEDLALETETLRNEFTTQNVRDATAANELVNAHEALRAETADAELKLKALAIDDEKLATCIRHGESARAETQREWQDLARALAMAAAEAEHAASAKKALEDDEAAAFDETAAARDAAQAAGADLARSAQHKASVRSSHADEQPRAAQAAGDAEAACAEDDKKRALCTQEELAAVQAHDSSKLALATTRPTLAALADATAALDADQLQQQQLALERGAAAAAHAAREAAAAATLEQELAAAERVAASGGPGAAAKKRTLEDLQASLQNDNAAFHAAYTAEKEAGKKSLEAKKAEVAAHLSQRAAAKDAADKECKKIDASAKAVATKVKQLDKKLAATKKAHEKHSTAAAAAKQALAEKATLLVGAQAPGLLGDEIADRNQPAAAGKAMDVDSDGDGDL